MAANSRLTLELETKAFGQESVDRLTAALDRFSQASERSARTPKAVAGGIGEVGTAAEGAEKKVKSFVGAIPGMGVAAERFIGLVPGLGQAIVNAFPVLGAIAFGEAIVRITGNVAQLFEGAGKGGAAIKASFQEIVDSGRLANSELQLANDRLRAEIAKLENRPSNGLKEALDETIISADKLGQSLSKSLSSAEELLQKNAVGVARQVLGEAGTADIDEELKRFKQRIAVLNENGGKQIAAATTGTTVGGVSLFTVESQQAQARAAQLKLNTELTKAYADELQRLQHLLGNTNSPGGATDKAARQELLRGTIALLEQQKRAIELAGESGDLKSQKDLSERGKTEQDKRNAAEDRAYSMAQELRARGVGLGGTEFDRLREESAKFLEPRRRREGNAVHFDSFSPEQVDQEKSNLRLRIAAEIKKQTAEQERFPVFGGINENSQILKSGDEFGRQQLQELDRRGAAILAGLKDWNAKLKQSDEANILGIRSGAEHQARLVSLTAQPGGEVAALQAQRQIREDALRQEMAIKESHSNLYNMDAERFKLQRDMQDAAWKYEEGIHELRNKNLASFKENVTRGFDDIISGRGGNIFKSFATGLERQIIGNLATMAFPVIQNATKSLHIGQGGFLGGIFAGTPFGADPLKGSAVGLTSAAVKLSAAGDKLLTAGAGSAAIGADGLPSAGSAAATAPGIVGTLNKWLGYGAFGAALGGGTFAAIQGFSRGGVSGAMQGAGAVAGMGAIIGPALAKEFAPVISKGLTSALSLAGPIGAIAGLALPLLGGLLGTNREKRSREISRMLDSSVYHAPTALNVEQDSNGNYTDRDYRGNLRTSGFRAMPSTRDPYTYWGPNRTPYEAPGGTVAPYVVQNNYYDVKAMDAASFREFARKNSSAFGEAAADDLQNSEGRFAASIRYLLPSGGLV